MLHLPLSCTIFLPSRPFTSEWLEQFFHRLWEHGLRFSKEQSSIPIWEEELEGIAEWSLTAGPGRKMQGGLTLKDFLEAAPEAVIGSISLWDKEVEMHMGLDPSGTVARNGIDILSEKKPFGEVELWVDGTYLHTDRTLAPLPVGSEHGRLLPPAQQMIWAFTHWIGVICDEVGALFAAGYDPVLDEPGGEYYDGIQQLLAEERIPPYDQWQWLIFVAPRFVHAELIRDVYEKGTYQKGVYQIRRTRSGGMLAVCPPANYRYEAGEAFSYQNQGFALESPPENEEQMERAILHYARARGIFAQIPDENMVGFMEDAIARVRAYQESTRQDAIVQTLPKNKRILIGSELSLSDLGHRLEAYLGSGRKLRERNRFFYVLEDRQADKKIRIWLKDRSREEKASQETELTDASYRYELEFASMYPWQYYNDPHKPSQLVEETAYAVFETLKSTGQYRLVLVGIGGEEEEIFEPGTM